MLKIYQFSKSYSSGFTLEIQSLELKQGTHLIKGENGSGKSTLFKAIAGIHAFEGEIILEGVSLQQQPVKFRKLVNYAEAEPQFPDFLSLDDLILFVSKAKEASSSQIAHLKEAFGVNNYAANSISSYSSGMLKKASLLLAFLGTPKLIILDEPFTTIDAEAQQNLLGIIKNKKAKGINFLISSHHLPDMQEFEFTSIQQLINGKLINR
ncbi:ABC transporter [Marivirga lumbricoides]|uniref:ABC transporter n=1 Tax=Marivirga lumbricoides TaxID=1046115 RepID=A0ABQ1MQV6_9BACT|nr:ABC transporter [Marivirga lumbricoides]